jgi:hypothetical protein
MKRHLFAIVLITAALVAAPIQNVLSFQGKLVEGGVPVDGTRNITFKIYNVATGGVFLWQESHVAVPVVGGLFNVELGSVTTFPSAVNFSEQYWVGVSVGGGAEISPRYKLTSAAYSMSPWTINGDDIYRDAGYVGIGTDSPIKPLHVEGTITGLASSGNAVGYFKNNATETDAAGIYAECANTPFWGYGGYFRGGYVGVKGEAIMAGTSSRYGVRGEASAGVSNYGVYGSSSGTATNNYGVFGAATGATNNYAGYFGSGDVYIANNLGVGTTSPQQKVHIAGGTLNYCRISTDGFTGLDLGQQEAGNALIRLRDNAHMIFFTNNAEHIRLTNEGKVGVGTTTPQYKMHVRHTVATHSAANSPTIYASVATASDSIVGVLAGQNGFQGVYGMSSRVNAYGVYGYTTGNNSRAVYGYCTGAGTHNYGVFGDVAGTGSTNYGVVGMATLGTTNYGLYCSGNGGYTGSWSNLSDIKFKKNIRPMEGILDKIMMLKPKTFEMRTDEFSFMGLNEGTQYGLIAQELVEVFPELVSQGHHPGETDRETREIIHEGVDYTQVDYIPLTAILVRAVQELKAEIEQLKTEIEKLKENK